MINEQPDVLNLLKKLQESTTEDIDEERGSFKKGDKVTYDMLGGGLTNSDLIRMLGTNEHATRANHSETVAEIVEAIGEEVARYSIMFEDGFVINDVAASELKSVKEEFKDTPEKEWNPIGSHDKRLTGKVRCANCEEEVKVVDRETGLCKDCFQSRFKWQEESKTNEAEGFETVDFADKFKEKFLKQLDDGMERDTAIRNALNIVSQGAFARLDIRGQKRQFKRFLNLVKSYGKTFECEDIEEFKTNEAEEAAQTMKPQEKPNINAEDFHMEDYSEEDLEKVKSKSEETGNAIRQVEDDELKIEPDKVVKPKKESKLKEVKKFGVFGNHRETNRYHASYYDSEADAVEAAKKLDATHYAEAWTSDEKGQFDNLDQIIWKSEPIKKESKTNEQETTITPSKVGLKKISDEKLKQLHDNSLHSFHHWVEDKEAANATLAAKAVEKYEDEMVDREMISNDARSEDILAYTKEKKESKFSFMKKQKPLWLCDECHRTFRANEGTCEKCKSKGAEKIVKEEEEVAEQTAGFTKEVFQVTWKNTDTGEEESTRVMAFDKADARREAKRPNREITTVEGPITEEPRKEEGKVPFDQDKGGKVNEQDVKPYTVTWQNLDEPHGKFRFFDVNAHSESHAEAKAIETLKRDGVPEKFIEIKAVELKESKTNEQEDDWDLTFEYKHNLIWHNPLMDKEGEPFIWQKHPIANKRIRVFTDYQADWVERNKGISVRAELEEKATEAKEVKPTNVVEIVKSTVDPDAYNIRVVELPEGSIVILATTEGKEEALKRGKEIADALNAKFAGIVDEKKVEEQEKDTFKTIAKGITDKVDADKLATEKDGQVVTDEDDEKKFAVIVKEE